MDRLSMSNVDERIKNTEEELQSLEAIIQDLIDCINLLGGNESERFQLTEPASRNMLNLKLSNELERKIKSYSSEKAEVLESIRILKGFKENCLLGDGYCD
ncbi:MAG: hypothetical protein ACI9JT_001848 [Polaribacter sp.]|jgi:hypothetical protein